MTNASINENSSIEIKEVLFDSNTLMEVRDFDKSNFYGQLNLNPSWYLSRYLRKTAFIAYAPFQEIVGYIATVPIKKELYDTIVNGIIFDDIYVNPHLYIEDSHYIYIPSVLVQTGYRDKQLGSTLIEKVLDKYKNKSICCITISIGGYRLAKKYFTHKCNIIEGYDVFVKEPN